MSTPLRILILEDQPADVEMMVHELRRAGFDPDWRRVETEPEYLAHLEPTLDLILADNNLPQHDAMRALRFLQGRGLDIPFIVVTGSISEEVAVECMKEGAADYLLKDRLARLGPAVAQALENTRTDSPADVIIGKGEVESVFIISDCSEKELLKKLSWQSFLGIYGGAALSLALLAYLLFRFNIFGF